MPSGLVVLRQLSAGLIKGYVVFALCREFVSVEFFALMALLHDVDVTL